MTTAHNNRAFMAQETLDVWLADDRVSLDGEVLKLLTHPRTPAFLLTTAVYFEAEVTTGEDPLGLCGQVKSLPKVLELGGEHAPGSVVIGDNAYEVRDGFLGELLPDHDQSEKRAGSHQRDPDDGRVALAALSTLASAVQR
jgi:hypothetical protein